MSAQTRNILIGVAIAVIGIVGLAALGIHGISAESAPLTLGLFTWYILSNLSSNEKVPSVPDAERSALLATPPPPGHGLLYVYREGFTGKALGIDIVVDGFQATQLKSPRFARLVVSAGEHMLAAGMKGFAGAQSKAGATPVWIADGGVTVVGVKLKMGMSQGQVTLTQEPDPRVALQRLTLMPMVRAAGQ